MLYIGLKREKHEKIFLSETISPRAMIFGMKHHLGDYAPGDTYFTLVYIGKNIENLLVLNHKA